MIVERFKHEVLYPVCVIIFNLRSCAFSLLIGQALNCIVSSWCRLNPVSLGAKLCLLRLHGRCTVDHGSLALALLARYVLHLLKQTLCSNTIAVLKPQRSSTLTPL